MKLRTVVFSLVASVALCQDDIDLLGALQSDPDTQGFGQLLGELPDLINNLDLSKKWTVFAPPNEAVAAFRQSFGLNGSLVTHTRSLHRRAISEYAAAIALLFTDKTSQTFLNTQATDLITNLTDPAFINITPPDVSATLTESSISPTSSSGTTRSSSNSVQPTTSSSASTESSTITPSTSEQPPSNTAPPLSSTAPPPSSTLLPTSTPLPPTSSAEPETQSAGCPSIPGMAEGKRSISPHTFLSRRQFRGSILLVSSGFGKISTASISEKPYKNGGVRKVDSFFTLFGELGETLQQTNGTAFANALTRAGTLDSLSKTPRVTIFVPRDAALQGQDLNPETLKRYVLLNTLATTPKLKAGSYKTSAGGSVNVAFRPDGSVSVNNATIVKSDVMIKNGVIHYIDSIYTDTFTGSAPGITIPGVAIAIALLVSSMSMF